MSPSMVGIVVVSHSARLAEGVCEVAAQMAPDVPLRPAGGTDEGHVGTSFDKILAAATEADTGAGAVILYDLGSAKMSADLVAETNDRLRVVDAPLVEGALAAAVTAQSGASLDAVVEQARSSGGARGVSGAEGGVSGAEGGVPGAEGGVSGAEGGVSGAEGGHRPAEASLSRVLTLRNPHGLHARPAARLARIAAEHGVILRAGPAEGPLVDARSILALVALGLRGGRSVRIEVQGEKAAEALSIVQAAIEDGFGERAEDAAPSGVAAVPGIAIGPLRRLRAAAPVLRDAPGDDPEAERATLEAALARVDRALAAERSDVAEAHRALLDDPELAAAARTAIANGLAAAPAWWRAVQRAREQLASSSDELIAQRAIDVTDVGLRVLSQLAPEATRVDVSHLTSAIVLADDVTPSMVTELADAGIAGIVLAQGGVTAHSVVVARGRAIPMLVRAGEHTGVADGTLAILDGDRGALIPAPEAHVLEDARARQVATAAARATALERAHMPVTTADGRTLTIAANVASPAEAELARKQGADAIGLLRTELFYVNEPDLPTEDEQAARIARILAPFTDREVTIRTLDAGGDKDIPALGLDPITHGFLGLRGLRYSLAHPRELHVQLRAILRAAASWKGILSIMAPMVTTASEVLAFRAAIAAAARSLEGTPHRLPDHTGIMVEVPAAAIAFDSMAPHVDFVSIGTNDLVQYIMAAERTNAHVADLYQPDHPAIWRALELLTRAASGKKIAVCGEMAANADMARRLVDLGVEELSMASASIPAIKSALRQPGR
ncbi:dihydroxyacetone kinase phosphoryl donor subunit DhaM [Pendulispora albinea]|uniref:phosphoenolpyruvate--glycerone phosphotransferase n=1 Tax=Pendulispora albinea TaxID=2741071 RepID=A0ABZ2M6I4_9BACT